MIRSLLNLIKSSHLFSLSAKLTPAFSHGISFITEEKLDIDCIKKKENMLEVKIISPPQLEENVGFMAYVCSAISERGIIIVETYSCYTDTIFIFDKKDLTKVVETLESIGIK